MKSLFFKKAPRLPHSASCDSHLSDQQSEKRTNRPSNNSIDKPGPSLLRPIPDEEFLCTTNSATTCGRHLMPTNLTLANCHNSQQTPLSYYPPQQLPSISSPCSSTQGEVGCTNKLFEQCGLDLHLQQQQQKRTASGKRRPTFDSVQRPFESPPLLNDHCLVKEHSKRVCGQQIIDIGYEGNSLMSSPTVDNNNRNGGNGQVAELVFTLAKQLAGKDAEISRLRSQLRKGECRMERMGREFEREMERKGAEMDTLKEQLARTKRKLRSGEAELAEMANRIGSDKQQQRGKGGGAGEHSAMASVLEDRVDKLAYENDQLKAELVGQRHCSVEQKCAWERERKELEQSVRSLNGTLEELESELRHREAREREMQLELERLVAERELAKLGLGGEREAADSARAPEHMLMDIIPSPKAHSASGGDAALSCASSSGISSSLPSSSKESPAAEQQQREIDRLLRVGRGRIAECRHKIANLVRAAEKTLRGERLTREDLFGVSRSLAELATCGNESGQQQGRHKQDILPSPCDGLEEHVRQIAVVHRDLELLHDKFTILYARGAIGP